MDVKRKCNENLGDRRDGHTKKKKKTFVFFIDITFWFFWSVFLIGKQKQNNNNNTVLLNIGYIRFAFNTLAQMKSKPIRSLLNHYDSMLQKQTKTGFSQSNKSNTRITLCEVHKYLRVMATC